MEIRRDKYLGDLVARKGNGMIKVVTGIRRCGKTYLVFDCPTDDTDRIVANIADYKLVPLDRRSSLPMFDEVQLCERAQTCPTPI